MMIRSRLAPTPSGYLHAGNAINFAITAALTRAAHGSLGLRIDDLDAQRVRPEYIADILDTLGWLGIAYDTGPKNTSEAARLSQGHRVERYIRLVDTFIEKGNVYACTCSRREVEERTGSLIYDGHCRNAGHAITAETILRFALPERTIEVHDILRGTLRIDLLAAAGDPVIRRRDGLPAYHIASLADDLDQQVNLIVRGEDLLFSTATQLVLADALGRTGRAFTAAHFLHHALATAEDGRKLSKSQGDSPLRAKRLAGESTRDLYRQAAALLQIPAAENLAELSEAVLPVVMPLLN
ncbi:MAG: glutamate--tRNA ligase family protein [Turneriella sp.]